MNVTTDLDARFRAAAVAEGIVDVRYDVVASPVGDLHVAATGRGLCRISYQGDDLEDRLAHGFGVRVLRSARPIDGGYENGSRDHRRSSRADSRRQISNGKRRCSGTPTRKLRSGRASRPEAWRWRTFHTGWMRASARDTEGR